MDKLVMRLACQCPLTVEAPIDYCFAPVDGCPEAYCPKHCAEHHQPHGDVVTLTMELDVRFHNPRKVRVLTSIEEPKA